ncbi:MAG: von Willebrand factor type A domain-containing protein [Kiritimatiellia bacterium]
MKCEEIREKLTAYLLGDLDGKTAAEVKAHLDKCGDCRAYMREIEPTLDLLRDALAQPPSKAPEHLSVSRRQKITNALPGAKAGARRKGGSRVVYWLFSSHPVLTAAAACLLLTFVFAGILVPSMMKATFKMGEVVADSSTAGYRAPKSARATLQGPDTGRKAEGSEKARHRKRRALREAHEVREDDRETGFGGGGGGAPAGADMSVSFELDASRPEREAPAQEGAALPSEPAPAEEMEEFPDLEDSIVKSPVIMKGIFGSRSSGARGSAVAGKKKRANADSGVQQKEVTEGGESAQKAEKKDFFWHAGTPAEAELAETMDGASEQIYRRMDADRLERDGRREEVTGRMSGEAGGRPGDGEHASAISGIPIQGRLFEEKKRTETESREKAGKESPPTRFAGPATDFSPKPADFNSVALVKSPVIVNKGNEKVDFSDSGDIEVGIDFYKRQEPKAKPKEPEETGARFRAVGVNPFYYASERAFSTFAIDVDTASYTLSRNYMTRGFLPPAESVRTEEFVNFFDYAYDPPQRDTFRVYLQCAPSEFGRGLYLMKIGVKGKRLGREEQQKAVLTLVIDSSGSMNTPDRMELVRKSVRMLVSELAPSDRVGIVRFGSDSRLVLPHIPASEKERIFGALDRLRATGSTNLEEGMRTAYAEAARAFEGGAANRVLVMSDGAANLGTGAAEDILEQISDYRKQGIYCSVFGFGIGTYNDEMLEKLANKGDGTYSFIDSKEEAKRVLVDNMAATLNTIASDVKIQVEFNPRKVKRYRQLGYENRQLRKEQFRDDTVDAGEVGSGQSVTALYEMEFRDGKLKGSDADAIATVRVRYRRMDTGEVEEIEKALRGADVAGDFNRMDARFKLAAGVAEFAEILRGCPHAAGSTYEDVARVLRPVSLELHLDKRVQELVRMVEGANGMARGEF